MPAQALESAQATLQGAQILMTRQGGNDDETETGGRRKGGERKLGGYALSTGSSASNEGLKGLTHSTIAPIEARQSRQCKSR